jgi:hypothetical protein
VWPDHDDDDDDDLVQIDDDDEDEDDREDAFEGDGTPGLRSSRFQRPRDAPSPLPPRPPIKTTPLGETIGAFLAHCHPTKRCGFRQWFDLFRQWHGDVSAVEVIHALMQHGHFVINGHTLPAPNVD